MTLPQAHDTARNGADRFGNTWRVFRLPAWPGGVYTASAIDPLPDNAHVVETYPKADAKPAKARRVDPQGSLF